jgi:hypothetical protein
VKKIFLLLTCKGSLPPLIGQGDRPLGGWLEKKSSSLRSGIFFRQALRNQGRRQFESM